MFGLSKREKKGNDAATKVALIGEGYRWADGQHLLGHRTKVMAELVSDRRAHMLAEMGPEVVVLDCASEDTNSLLAPSKLADRGWWLSRYRMGPLEWIWREPTHGEVPPLRNNAPGTASAGTAPLGSASACALPGGAEVPDRRGPTSIEDATAPRPGRPEKPPSGRIGLRQTTTSGTERGNRILGPEDYEGYEVHDPLGQRVGRAEKLFVNGDGDPKHVRVRLGFFGKSVLIPAVGINANHERRTIVLGSSASGKSC